MLSYLIVGSGYRALFYGRIARTYPDRFACLFLCRNREKVEKLQSLGMQATQDMEDVRAFSPDLAVIAVSKADIAHEARIWAEHYPVLTETPAGNTLEKLLDLWALHESGARILTCEQYFRYPVLMAGLEAVQSGRIGTPQSAYVSLMHEYHAASILRRMLLTRGEAFELRGVQVPEVLVETDSREGPVLDGHMGRRTRELLFIRYASGKQAVYDFSGVQYHSFIRTRHLTVRGTHGEWNDRMLYRVDENHHIEEQRLLLQVPERYRCLWTPALQALQDRDSLRLGMENAQDEFAMASMLLDMEAYLQGGPEPYPLWEALEDAYMALLMHRAWKDPWEMVQSEQMPWQSAEANLQYYANRQKRP